MPGKDLCLLSLDGGGVRGLSSLAILKRLMETINPDAPPKPCEYFDMIGGTSTGGLIAIMLGRLEMTIDECIDAYVALFDRVFRKKRHRITIDGSVQGRFDTEELERSIREIVKRKDKAGENALLKGSENQQCKVFVCALSKETSDTVLFTSYLSRGSSDMYHKTRIWEAARATSAASSFFDPIKIGQFEEEFVDGAVGANNPVAHIWNEARYMWSDEALEGNIKCLVSIGTGVPSLDSYGSSLFEIAKALKDIATETEKTAETFHRAHSDLGDGNRYFRFNVSHGLESIGLEDAAQKNKIMAATTRYVALESVMSQMKLCGNNLSTREYSGPYQVQFNLRGLTSVPNFVARDQEMNDLKKNLFPQPTRATHRKVFVLHGPGGSGKTQLAIEFARRSQKIFSSIFWLNGDSRESVRQGFAQIARQLLKDQIPDSYRKLAKQSPEELDEIISNVLIWFNGLDNDRWLLIFDNVDRDTSLEVNDPKSYDVEEFFPEVDQGSILITSRLRQLRQHGQDRLVGRMSNAEGAEVLQCRIGRSIEGNENQAMVLIQFATKRYIGLERIVEKVGGLPLALAHAGSFIHGTTTSVNDYIRYYEETWEKLHDNRTTRLKDYPRSILSTYTMSYEYVQRSNASAARLLDLFAYLDHSDLWYSLFTPALNENLVPKETIPTWLSDTMKTEFDFTQKIQILLDYSLIKARYQSSSYAVHPIIHDWCFHSSPTSGDEIASLAVSVIGSACVSADNSAEWLHRQRLTVHCSHVHSWIGKQTENLERNERLKPNLSSLYHAIGSFLGDTDKLEEAETMYQRALKGCEKAWGPEHTSTLNTVNNLGNLYVNQGKMKEAENMYQRALQGFEKALGPEHTSTLNTVNNLGNFYARQRKMKEAEDMYQRALKGYGKALGPEHTSTLNTVSNLGVLYADQDRMKEAEDMYQRALQGFEKALGPEHTSTLNTVNNLGTLYARQRKMKEAEDMYQRALKGYGKALGPERTSKLNTVSNLGNFYADQDRMKEAEDMYQRALKGYEKAWGPEHTSTLDIASNLGLLYANQGKIKEAENMYQRALKGFEKAVGPEHKSTLDTVNNLGIFYAKQGKMKEAENMYQRALKGYEKALGTEHTSTLQTVNNLGLLYASQGKMKEAEDMYQRALKGYEKTLGLEHTSTLRTVNNLGNLYADQNKMKEAEDMYQRALKGCEKTWGPEHTSTLDTVNNLGNLYTNQGKMKEAENMYQRALKGYEKALGTEHTSTLRTVNNLGNLYANQGKMKEAENMFQRALKGYEKALGPEHTSTLRTVNNLGHLYANQGKMEEVEALFQRVLKGRERS